MGSGDGLAVVLGAGPVGLSLVEQLAGDGQATRVVNRSGAANVPAGVDVVAADVTDAEATSKACAGADVVYGCVGLDYTGWPERWPPMMAGMLAGAGSAGARFVFMDNCYMYGPVSEPIRETMPLTDYGNKPSTRAAITRMWQQAHDEGRVEAASVRASDFYGPGVSQSALGDLSIGRIARGKSAQVVGDPDQPHSFTYVPDVARALVTVARADDAMGQAWNVPNAPICSTRAVLEMFAEHYGHAAKVQSMPTALMSLVGLFNGNVREMKEMLYQWERPFVVDSSKFEQRFWSDATPFEDGVAATAPTYLAD